LTVNRVSLMLVRMGRQWWSVGDAGQSPHSPAVIPGPPRTRALPAAGGTAGASAASVITRTCAPTWDGAPACACSGASPRCPRPRPRRC